MNAVYRRKNRLSIEEYVDGILSGNRVVLSKAITLVESSLDEDNQLAEKVLEKILPHTGNSIRIGITGVPGVGKSTFIESFGSIITSGGKKLAVLTVDPSSQRSRGSILGDKTRMEQLANDPLAFIRPSASGSSLGGVSSKTRETMLLCEAAGHEVIFIETVGVGQSETSVHGMVDFFLLLMLAGAGDELQGIKKGIMEMADAIAITKADGENKKACERAKREYQNALHLFSLNESQWSAPVLTCSSIDRKGLDEILKVVEDYKAHTLKNGHFFKNRENQNTAWMYEIINFAIQQRFYKSERVRAIMKPMEQKVKTSQLPAISAAREMLNHYWQ
ncbi:MAG: methylmalonyl Co-A mutase-associated GTPase MeaB [Cyclobacteriaceae bacterium]|nr:methylmalonyl Co-A mutase-associated GTPase MeaB [Cyclobacteriaceae bacterium]